MRSYIELGQEIRQVVGEDPLVKFQPPPSVKLTYPCVIYSLSKAEDIRADNKAYVIHGRYQVTHIYKSIDNALVNEFLDHFEMITHDNRQIVDGLYHDYYTIYF